MILFAYIIAEHAEADAFFCFTNLMSEVMDNFCKTLDKSEMGIVGNMKRLNLLFKEQDLELWNDLVTRIFKQIKYLL